MFAVSNRTGYGCAVSKVQYVRQAEFKDWGKKNAFLFIG